MPLIADASVYIPYVVPFYSLDGMTLLIGAFFFYCLARPERVQNRTQFWAVFACLMLIILLYGLRLMLYNSPAGQVFTGVFIALLQAGGMLLTVLYVGGLHPRELADELTTAAGEFRRSGQPEKPVIVPLSGEKPAPHEERVPPRVVIDLPQRDPDERIRLE